MNINDLVSLLSDGISDSGILFILVIIDTTLALTYAMKSKKKIISSTLLSGILRNLVLSSTPLAMHWLATIHPRNDLLYNYFSVIFSVLIGIAIIQSILAYTDLWGIKYPQWIKSWLKSEIEDKVGKNNTDKANNNN